jgi:ATP-dependent DNA ligase
MLSALKFCLPTSARAVPDRPNWLHEVKYDGYPMMVIRDGERVRLISRGGIDYASRFPWIVEAARKRPQRQFIIDGEAVLLVFQGTSDFDGLHSGKHDDEVRLYAFDILALDGDDLRQLLLSTRKQRLQRLLFRLSHRDGIFVAPFDHGEIGPELFKAACQVRLEGIVSKRADRPYRVGRSKDWIKIKNRKHPAYRRLQDQF